MTVGDLIKDLSRYPFDTRVALGTNVTTDDATTWRTFYVIAADKPAAASPLPPSFRIVGGTAARKGPR